MTLYSRNRQFPAGHPLANVLVVIVGALAIGLSVILGVVAFIVLGTVVLVLAAIIGVRLWWLNRKVQIKQRPHRAQGSSAQQRSGVEVIEGEFQVVSEDNESGRPANK